MKVKNETFYSTRLLRSLIVACHDDRRRTEGDARAWKALTVRVVYWRSTAAGIDREPGLAFRLCLPRAEVSTRWLAYIVTWGLFGRRGTGRFTGANYEFAVQRFGATIKPEPEKPKAKPAPTALVEKRHKAAVEALAKWRRKATLAANKVRRYTKTVARYEKLLAEVRVMVPVSPSSTVPISDGSARAFNFDEGR